MKKVGITGGIGSGKTTVCRLFHMMGIPVYNADDAARKIMHTPVLKEKLIIEFGDIYIGDDLNRDKLANLVFNDPEKLAKLNSIVHPHVINDYVLWEAAQNAPFILRESAILFESGTNARLDKVITVTAPEELRIKRSAARDSKKAEDIIAIIKRQMPEEEKVKRSDYIICNDDVSAVLPQVRNIYNELDKLA